NPHVLVEFLEAHAHTRDGAACSGGAREAVDPTVHLLPEFWSGAFNMRPAIGGVVELVGPDRALGLLSQTARGVDEMAGVREWSGGHEDQLCPQRAQGVHLLARLGL